MLEIKKKHYKALIKRMIKFRRYLLIKYLSSVNLSLSPDFQKQPLTDVFKIGVCKNFAIFTGKKPVLAVAYLLLQNT